MSHLFRFYSHFFLVLYGRLDTVDELNRAKQNLICNANLTKVGWTSHIPDVIIQRASTNYWGSITPSYFTAVRLTLSRDSVIADVVEAVIGAVCYYKSMISALQLVSFLLRQDEFSPGLIRCYQQGFISPDLQNYFRCNSYLLPLAELETHVKILEEVQQYTQRSSVRS